MASYNSIGARRGIMFPLSVNVRRHSFHPQIDEVCSLSIVIFCCLSSVLLHALLQIVMKHTLS